MRWYEKHEASLLAAGRACRERSYFTLFPETPDRHRGGAAAAETGLADQAHLTRAFARRYGVTPARYRRQLRG